MKRPKKKNKKKERKNSIGSESNPTTTCKVSQAISTQSSVAGVVGDPISDPQIGKTCHQCHQKTMVIVAACSALRRNKPCTLNFCRNCLLNRYGEKAESVQECRDWQCPKCRGICNCSICMRSKGSRPTGILTHHAKAKGYSSVSQMLAEDPSVALRNKERKKVYVSGEDDPDSKSQSSRPSSRCKKRKNLEKSKGNTIFSNRGRNGVPESLKRNKTRIASEMSLNSVKKELRINETDDTGSDVNIQLPLGTDSTSVVGDDISSELVGNALQFLEFCNAVWQRRIQERNRHMLRC